MIFKCIKLIVTNTIKEIMKTRKLKKLIILPNFLLKSYFNWRKIDQNFHKSNRVTFFFDQPVSMKKLPNEHTAILRAVKAILQQLKSKLPSESKCIESCSWLSHWPLTDRIFAWSENSSWENSRITCYEKKRCSLHARSESRPRNGFKNFSSKSTEVWKPFKVYQIVIP